MDSIIAVENVSYRYHDTIPGLSNVTLTVREGEKFAVIGANGSGKSTLLRVMSGLVHPNAGQVFFNGCLLAHHLDQGDFELFHARLFTICRQGLS